MDDLDAAHVHLVEDQLATPEDVVQARNHADQELDAVAGRRHGLVQKLDDPFHHSATPWTGQPGPGNALLSMANPRSSVTRQRMSPKSSDVSFTRRPASE